MNCQEGMDYMQRQLDGDLDERETDLLLDHTRQCPDCAEMFERLKRLSAELENLPRIAPSYSIVDSIMPRLEQLELQRQLGETDQADERQYQTRRSRSNSRQKRTRSFPYRMLGGVIAAGIVAGLFIVTYKPLGLQTANDSAATNSAVMLESKSSEPAANRSGAESPEKLPAKKDAAQLYSIDQNGSAESAPGAADAPKESMTNGSGNTELQVPPSSSPEAEQRQGETGNTESADTFAAEADSGSAQNQEGSAGQEAEFYSEKSAPAEDRFTVGLTAAGPEPFVSPDGAFQAVVQDETVEIYNTEDNSLIFKSRKSGSIENVNWSQDSAMLSYDVFSGEDSIERYIIDVKNKSETKRQADDN